MFYYGGEPCGDADGAYERFRDDYHRWLGKRVYRRLNRVGQREERVHEYGFCFAGGIGRPSFYDDSFGKLDTRLLGLVCGSYCRMLGGWSVPCGIDEPGFYDLLDWALSSGSGATRLLGRNTGVGRTNKMINKRYR